MVLEYSPTGCNFFGIAGHLIMDNDLGRLVDGREARRPHSALPSGTRLCYPFAAAGGTDKDDADYVYVPEAPMDAPAAVPPVASSAQNQIQMKLSSFIVPASALQVAAARA